MIGKKRGVGTYAFGITIAQSFNKLPVSDTERKKYRQVVSISISIVRTYFTSKSTRYDVY